MDSKTYDAHRAHTSGARIHTDSAISHAILEQYPKHCLTCTQCDLIIYADAGHATMSIVPDGPPLLLSRSYEPTTRGEIKEGKESSDMLASRIWFGCYEYIWNGHDFLVYVANAQNSLAPMANDRRFYIVSEPYGDEVPGRSICAIADALILAVGIWTDKSDEVWVFDNSSWQKDRNLWLAIRKSGFRDIIGDESRELAIERDTVGFFDAGERYEAYGVPWKRGLIFHGPPGNGKTMTIKAIMRSLVDRQQAIPTLYIKSIASRVLGPQGALRVIFTKARQAAPCLLVFEDIDSIVTDEVRSYFFNEMDGLEDNNGILVIGSTNDLERLDVGLSQRPSRFDRKYDFKPPTYQERIDYCSHWNQKLNKTASSVLSNAGQMDIASKTEGFSFAYLKEAYVSALLTLARRAATKAVEDDTMDLATILQEQIDLLRAEMVIQAK